MDEIQDPFFLFSYFKGHGDGLHLAWSRDGFHWTALKNDQPFITPLAGPDKLMRDPFLFHGQDGLFHLAWTAGWHGKGIGYASSMDLVNWSPQQFLGVMEHESGARNCWAPEIFFDDVQKQYIIYWASSIPGRFADTDHTGDDGLNHRMYCVLTPDFQTFSETKLFFDGGFNVIDATLVKDDNRYLLFMKDETLDPCQKNIRVAISDKLFGGFGKASPPITGPYWAEGPTAIKISGHWIVYFDKYELNEIGAVRSADLSVWQDISDQLHFPPGGQHGSVMKIPFGRVKHLL
ncbi:MAG: glycoside hydrolase family 43 protein [Cyclobacteriaceae bacterium]